MELLEFNSDLFSLKKIIYTLASLRDFNFDLLKNHTKSYISNLLDLMYSSLQQIQQLQHWYSKCNSKEICQSARNKRGN